MDGESMANKRWAQVQGRLMAGEVGEQMVIEGIVTPCSWDDSGTVTAVTISANDEEEYSVRASAGGDELISLMHKHIRAKGIFRTDEGSEVFVVREFEIIS